ncbi:MAG TPA: FAD-binding oxidoreductase [Tepidisphaeraceae bacterium]
MDELVRVVRETSEPISIAGGRHAMGGQQFGTNTLHLDTRSLNAVLAFDAIAGTIDVEAGIDWPTLIAATHRLQPGQVRWGINQKQTGADDMTLAGSISANAHGRGLLMQPIVQDVEHLDVLLTSGEIVRCSRSENCELFSLVVGGYGLFGIILRVRLRLAPRVKVRRLVDIIDLDDAANAIYRRVESGCTFGDFQYSIDAQDTSFLRRGVFPCYHPVDDGVPIDEGASDLKRDDWLKLIGLAYRDKREAFARYSQYYLSTHGRVYWSDTMQLSTYVPDYAQTIHDAPDAARPDESLMIGELYVPPNRLLAFMSAARRVLHDEGVEDIYGTIRAIQQDAVTFLPWARANYACVIFNLRTLHTPQGIATTCNTFRRLNDAAIAEGGSFFLTYHRYATREQIEACYPMFQRFLHLKRTYDPAFRIESDWYRHHREMLS